MVYQILSQQRTGTHFLKSYIGGKFGEFFIGEEGPLPSFLVGIPRDAGYKFNWLEKEKKFDHHHPVTVTDIRRRISYYSNFVERLIHYYEGYHILTINRNPWDIFMSWYFQQQTGWKFAHQLSEQPFPEYFVTDKFKIEASIMIKTLREFHQQPIYIICDDSSKKFLEIEGFKNIHFSCELSKEKLKEVKQDLFLKQ